MKRIFFGVALMVTCACAAWQDEGHMLVAEVARQELSPEALEQCEELLEHFGEDFPESNTFVTAACFADDLISMGLPSSKQWHTVSAPYDPEGLLEGGGVEAKANLVNGIEKSREVLADPTSNRWAKCFALRMLIHFVGDIHEPLHCGQLYSSQFPGGDETGRLFVIEFPSHPNLHKLWDSAFRLWPHRIGRPLSDEDQLWLSETAAGLRACYPKDEMGGDPEGWAQESYQLAIDVAYDGIELGDAPSEAYMARGSDVARRQLTVAGYRLAHLIEQTLGN